MLFYSSLVASRFAHYFTRLLRILYCYLNMNARGGFIGAIIAAIVAGAGAAVGAAVIGGQTGMFGPVVMIDDPTGKNAPSLQLKSLIPITLTPRPTNVPSTGGVFGNCEYNGNGPGLEGVRFDEPQILVDYEPKAPNVAGLNDAIRLWAGDENSIVMGTATVNGTIYPITESGINPTTVNNPKTGAPYEPDGKDSAGRPMFPALFLTDVTTPNELSRVGDWQQGGTPIGPHVVSGVWIYADKNGSSVTSRSRPTIKNVVNKIWNLAPGGTAPAPGTSYEDASYYGTEIRWNVADLLAAGKIQTGKTYRAQFMVHDGDSDSDVAQGCVTIQL